MKSVPANHSKVLNTLAIRILKVGTCPSLSGKSTLTYHVGCEANGEIQFRVYANSSTGFFSQEWVALSTIQQTLAKSPGGKPITSFLLYPLFRGKSLNTPAFLFAALKSEGLVRPSEVKKRSYECTDPQGFMSGVQALIASGVDLKVDDKPLKADVKPKEAGGKPMKTEDKPQADGKPQKVEGKPQADVNPESTEAQAIEGKGQNTEPKPRRAAAGKKATPKAMPQKKA